MLIRRDGPLESRLARDVVMGQLEAFFDSHRMYNEYEFSRVHLEYATLNFWKTPCTDPWMLERAEKSLRQRILRRRRRVHKTWKLVDRTWKFAVAFFLSSLRISAGGSGAVIVLADLARPMVVERIRQITRESDYCFSVCPTGPITGDAIRAILQLPRQVRVNLWPLLANWISISSLTSNRRLSKRLTIAPIPSILGINFQNHFRRLAKTVAHAWAAGPSLAAEINRSETRAVISLPSHAILASVAWATASTPRKVPTVSIQTVRYRSVEVHPSSLGADFVLVFDEVSRELVQSATGTSGRVVECRRPVLPSLQERKPDHLKAVVGRRPIRVLVALQAMEPWNEELMRATLYAKSKLQGSFFSFRFRKHPHGGPLPPLQHRARGSLESNLTWADMLVTGCSNVGLDALAIGMPVVGYRSFQPEISGAEFASDFFRICDKPSDLALVLSSCLRIECLEDLERHLKTLSTNHQESKTVNSALNTIIATEQSRRLTT